MNASFYNKVKEILIYARNKVYQTANFAMVEAFEILGHLSLKNKMAVRKVLSKQMKQDFGKGFTAANLKNMRQFYLTFPNGYALGSELRDTLSAFDASGE